MTSGTQGEAGWIGEAVDRFERPLIRCAVRVTGDLEVARDVVQDTFMKLCDADRAKVEDHLAGWLFTVCRNRALDVLRKEGRMGRLKDSAAVVDRKPGSRPDEGATEAELRRMILEVVEGLSEQEQEAFRLKFQDGLTYREISQVMGKSLGTVSKLMTSALGSVREKLARSADEGEEAGR